MIANFFFSMSCKIHEMCELYKLKNQFAFHSSKLIPLWNLQSSILNALHCKYIQWDYSGNRDTHKKYLPYTLQCRSVNIRVNHCISVLRLFHCIGAAIRCKQCSGKWDTLKKCKKNTLQRCRNWGCPPPIFGRSVNPIQTGEGRLSPPSTTGTPKVFHIPASLHWIYLQCNV